MDFTRADLVDGLTDLGRAAVAVGKVVDLCLYGGSCLMLVSDFRQSSQDVDAVAMTDQPFVDRVTRTIAAARGWPEDWLNDGVRTFLSALVEAPDDHLLSASYPSEREPGLRIYVPTAEYMLAMKLMSLRIDEFSGGKDKDDIENLMTIVGIETKEALVSLASRYYPEARVSAKLLLSADALIADADQRRRRSDAPPIYTGRAGGGRDGR